ncbi:hypothetical protein B4U80_07802 [Leptotrombidium deliense]|uniref:Uncharacterized protein n=1 Tax=Leptotrombidium deliense TaxID=299467 RepID=A0A443S165_9ACAR|nr:hypothetical protein B4U80_07802 [Leptotrombidium deliense]
MALGLIDVNYIDQLWIEINNQRPQNIDLLNEFVLHGYLLIQDSIAQFGITVITSLTGPLITWRAGTIDLKID